MRMLVPVLLSLMSFATLPGSLDGQVAAAIASDPAPDKANPAAMESFQLPSHGAQLNALVYIASGAGPHPMVILLHGFPGNEKNLDLAQTMRRAGYDVLYFNYRGSWGSPGEFSFTHSIEDAQAAIAYMRDAANAKRLRSDPSKIILIGHSMGGFIARYVGAHDPAVEAVGLISAADMANDQLEAMKPEQRKFALEPIAKALAEEGLAPLACTPEGLAAEAIANADAWNVPALAGTLAARPVLVVTSEDGLRPSNDAFVAKLPKTAKVTTVHMTTDHSYSDHRIALETSILNWLASL